METLTVKHKLMFVSVKKSLSVGSAIYDAARFAWRVNVKKARNADYILAHCAGTVIGVFEAKEWLPADDPAFDNIGQDADASRWGFVGEVAPSEILLLYLKKELPEGFSKKGAANPIRFVFPEDEGTIDSNDRRTVVKNSVCTNLSPASEGHIDSEGDFCATLKLDISDLADDIQSVYAEGNVRSEIAGEVDETSSYGQADASDGCLEIRGGYIRVEEGVDPSYLVEADLEIVQFRKSDVLDITVPKVNGQLDVSYSSKGVKISEIVCHWDEDDGSCRISVITEGKTPYGVLFALAEKGQEVYPTHTIVFEGRGEFEEILFEVSPNGEAEITIEVGERIDVGGKLLLAGKAKVEERYVPEDLEEDDSFFDDELSPSPFVFCISSDDISDAMEESGEKAARDLLVTQLGTLMDALIDEVSDDTRFFVSDANKKPVEVRTNDDLEKILGLSSAIDAGSWFETITTKEGYIQITAILNGIDHWDDGFLRVSGCDGVPDFYVWGMYSPLGHVAVQGYFSGEFDTGIANDPTDDTTYSGKKIMEYYSISERQFNLDIYGIDEH